MKNEGCSVISVWILACLPVAGIDQSSERASECHSPHHIYNLLVRMRAIHELKSEERTGRWLREMDIWSGPWKELLNQTQDLANTYPFVQVSEFFDVTFRVKWILARTQRALNGIDLPLASPWLSASQVPWPLVLEACVNFRLTPLHSDPGLKEQDVYFLPEELDAFYPPTLWMQSVNLSKKEAAKAKR